MISKKDIFALSGMTFALFMGAGNIVFPPLLGYHSATHEMVLTILGFLITAVLIPITALVATARAGGDINKITMSLGRKTAITFASVCFLFMGPLYVAPRTAVVALETASKNIPQFTTIRPILVLVYFILVVIISLKPERLLKVIGFMLSPIKVAGLIFIAMTPFFVSWGHNKIINVMADTTYGNSFYDGLINGYLTMDTISAMIFGGVVCQSIRMGKNDNADSIVKVVAISGGIAGFSMMIVYTGFFILGIQTSILLQAATNGAQVLHAYVQFVYGDIGVLILELIVSLACLITAVGLVTSSSRYFSTLLSIDYRIVMVAISLLSLAMANISLERLIYFSLPALTIIYPPGMILVLLSLRKEGNVKNDLTCRLLFFVSLLFGIVSALKMRMASNFGYKYVLDFFDIFPLNDKGMGWILPCIFLYFICFLIKRYAMQRN